MNASGPPLAGKPRGMARAPGPWDPLLATLPATGLATECCVRQISCGVSRHEPSTLRAAVGSGVAGLHDHGGEDAVVEALTDQPYASPMPAPSPGRCRRCVRDPAALRHQEAEGLVRLSMLAYSSHPVADRDGLF